MNISKSCRRVMAVTLTCTMAFVGAIVSSNKVEAATPGASVKGANIKIASTPNGDQSLRVAIEVDNASAAMNCGIKLTNKGTGKTVTVRTGSDTDAADDVVIGNKIYEYIEEQNKLIYTVVINGIESSDFDTKFGVQAVVQKGDGTWDESESAEKSVAGVLTALKTATGNTYEIGADGALYETIMSVDMENEAASNKIIEASQYSNNNRLERIDSSNHTDGGSYCLSADSKADYAGIKVKNLPGLGEYKVSCYVKKANSSDQSEGIRYRTATTYASLGNSVVTTSDEWQKLEASFKINDIAKPDQHGNTNAILYISPSATTSNSMKYLVDDIVVKRKVVAEDMQSVNFLKPYTVGLSEATEYARASVSSVEYSAQGVKIDADPTYGGGGVAWQLNARCNAVDLSKYSKIKVTYVGSSSNTAGNLSISIGHIADKNWWGDVATPLAYPVFNSDDEKTVEISIPEEAKKNAYSIRIKYNAGQGVTAKATYTIKEIQLIP